MTTLSLDKALSIIRPHRASQAHGIPHVHLAASLADRGHLWLQPGRPTQWAHDSSALGPPHIEPGLCRDAGLYLQGSQR